MSASSAHEAARPLTEEEKMLRGLPYLAMNDMELVRGRLRARKYLKAYNVSLNSMSLFALYKKNVSLSGISSPGPRRNKGTDGFLWARRTFPDFS